MAFNINKPHHLCGSPTASPKMSYPCDGPSCKNKLSFYVKPTALEIASKQVAFTTTEIGQALNQHLLIINVNTPTPAIINYCETHWRKKAVQWAKDESPPSPGPPISPEVYYAARAKTTREGVFLQNNDDAFLKNVAVPQVERRPEPILSCVSHELIHYWSYNHRGLQGTGHVPDWDESTCDNIGYPVYAKVFKSKKLPNDDPFKNFVTPYAIYTEWIKIGKEKWSSLVNGRWGKVFVTEPARRANLPKTLQDYFAKAKNPPASSDKLGDKTKDMWETALTNMLWTWFFKGTNLSTEGYRNFDDFNAKHRDVFCEQVQNIFKITGERAYAI